MPRGADFNLRTPRRLTNEEALVALPFIAGLRTREELRWYRWWINRGTDHAWAVRYARAEHVAPPEPPEAA